MQLLALQFVEADAPLEQHAQQDVVDELEAVPGLPLLLVAQAQYRITVVPVLADDIGVGVMLIVVGAAP